MVPWGLQKRIIVGLVALRSVDNKKSPLNSRLFFLDMRMGSERIPRNADVIQQPLLPLRQQQLQQPSCQQQPFQPSGLPRGA